MIKPYALGICGSLIMFDNECVKITCICGDMLQDVFWPKLPWGGGGGGSYF